jgi:hypothetical protein
MLAKALKQLLNQTGLRKPLSEEPQRRAIRNAVLDAELHTTRAIISRRRRANQPAPPPKPAWKPPQSFIRAKAIDNFDASRATHDGKEKRQARRTELERPGIPQLEVKSRSARVAPRWSGAMNASALSRHMVPQY